MFQLRDIWAHDPKLQKSEGSQSGDAGGVKRSRRPVSPRPASHNKYSVLYEQNKMNSDHSTEREVRQTLKPLREVWLNVGLEKVDTHKGVSVKALLDSRAMGLFMSKKLAERQSFKLEKLNKPIKVRNVDGSNNKGGSITHEVEVNLFYRGHVERVRMDVCELGKTEVILGMPWLAAHNPEINWETGEVRMTKYPPLCGRSPEKKIIKGKQATEEDKKDLRWTMEEREKREEIKEDHRKVEELVPKRFHKWKKVFGKVESERMPTRKPWDHAIDLREDFVLKKGRIYPLSRTEKEEVQVFVENQLKKGYIRPSKSPQTSPVLFVPKKDGKRRMVQDYRYVNKGTIKNSYPLPLISELIDGMGTKKVFTKMDLRWGYNNVRIKEGDEWKVAFTTHLGSFEPTVMYFGLTNSPATFQAMMNDLFRDMVNKGDVATFINDILVATETEKGHDEIVEEVLRRLEENDLYVKPEKCMWKVREIGFLGVIMGPEGFRMEKEKVEGVTNWPTPQCVKDIQKFLGLANYYRRFVKDFARIAKPLHQLVRKDEKWSWGGGTGRSIYQVKRNLHNRTSTGSTRFGQGNEGRGRHIRLHYRGSIVGKRRGWKVETSGLHLQVVE